MDDNNQNESDNANDEIAGETESEFSLLLESIREVLVGEQSMAERLSQAQYDKENSPSTQARQHAPASSPESQAQYDKEKLSRLESLLLRGSAILGIELPSDYRYLPITRLYITILEKDKEISEDVQKSERMVKDDVHFHKSPSDQKEKIGKIISETTHELEPRYNAEESSGDLLLLLTLVSEVLERETALSFKSNIIDDEYRESDETDALIDGLSQDEIEGLLLRSGSISESIYSELQHVRNTRNTIVHNVNERLTLDQTTRASSEAHRAVNVLNDIVEMNKEVRPIPIQG